MKFAPFSKGPSEALVRRGLNVAALCTEDHADADMLLLQSAVALLSNIAAGGPTIRAQIVHVAGSSLMDLVSLFKNLKQRVVNKINNCTGRFGGPLTTTLCRCLSNLCRFLSPEGWQQLSSPKLHFKENLTYLAKQNFGPHRAFATTSIDFLEHWEETKIPPKRLRKGGAHATSLSPEARQEAKLWKKFSKTDDCKSLKRDFPKGAKHECAFCGASASKKCARCKAVWYCTADHQRSGWKEHKLVCKSASK